jgi:nucleotide-binding universal stress UspA family protein
LLDAQAVLRESLIASFAAGLAPQALTTVASQPWPEIIRVSQTYRCESLVLGFSELTQDVVGNRLEQVMSSVDCDVVVLRARTGWQLSGVKRVLVPVGGQGVNDLLRARILGSIRRTGAREITYLRIMPEDTSEQILARSKRELTRFAREEVGEDSHVHVVRNTDVVEEITHHASKADLLVLGLQRRSRRQKVFGHVSLNIAKNTTCGIVMILRRG